MDIVIQNAVQKSFINVATHNRWLTCSNAAQLCCENNLQFSTDSGKSIIIFKVLLLKSLKLRFLYCRFIFIYLYRKSLSCCMGWMVLF